MKKNLQNILPLLLLLLLAACTEHELFQDDEQVTLRYTVSLPQDAQTRTIGDGSAVDELIVGVFEENATTGVNFTFPVEKGKASPEIPLFKNRKYNLVFWAQKKDNGVYDTNDLSHIKIDYTKYPTTLEGAMALDAFSTTETGITSETQGGTITLTRPFAMLNIGAAGSTLEDVNKVELKVDKLYTSYHPLSETLVGEDVTTHTFTFEDLDHSNSGFTDEDETNYTYVASAFVLVPADYAPTISGKLISVDENKKEEVVKEIPETQLDKEYLTPNYTTNIGVALTEGWNGNIMIEKIEPGDDGIIHIDTAEKLAYLMKFGYAGTSVDNPQQIHLCKDFDMKGTITRAADYKLENVIFNGGNFTIHNLSTSLFGEATNLQVKDLTLSKATITDAGHAGALVDTLKASATFTNITLQDFNVTTSSGAAGGMVGYIVRKSEKDRSETLDVIFDNCKVTKATINASASEGKLVGLLSGYDHKETLTFKANCAAEGITLSHNASYYVDSNKSCWQSNIDFTAYSGFLGNETYCRATVNYGENRYWPKWDGERKNIVPLVESNVNLIYSTFDLAYFQGKSPASVSFKQNVDLGSHKITPISYITNLDGGKHTLYNLKVDMVHNGIGAAFIGSASGTTTHKNLTLVGADVKNVHDTSLYPKYAITNDGGAGNAYGAIFISQANYCTSYTIDNIHVKDSKLYAVCKMGGVIGQSTYTKLYMSNCSVDNCIIQNYQPNVPNYYVLGTDAEPWMKMSLGFMGTYYVNLLQWWYTNGEAGGLIGFLKAYDADIDKCSVTNTQINCIGQPDKNVIANVYNSKNFKTTDPFSTSSKTRIKGLTTIAGRHVNQFIGDIVSERAEGGTNFTVDITNYTVSGNSYNGTSASSANTYNHQYDKTGDSFGKNSNLYCEVVGSAYYVGIDLNVSFLEFGHMKYCAGNVSFSSLDEKQSGSFTEAVGDDNNIAWTGGNFSIYSGSDTYPSEPTRKDPIY